MTYPRDAQTAPELLPCPFCGCDKVVIYYDHPDSVGPVVGGGFYISHPLWKDFPISWGCDAVPTRKYFDSKAEAIEAWNRRADTPARAGMGDCEAQDTRGVVTVGYLSRIERGIAALQPGEAQGADEADLDEAWKSGFNAGFGEAILTKDATPPAAQVTAPQWDDETCLLFAEGYDREDAAQRGEPSPHDAEGEDYAEWAMDRIACVRAALRALAGEK